MARLSWLRVVLWVVALLSAAPGASADPIDFVRDVRPILERHCYACHGPEKQKGGLRLDIRAAVLKGGESYGPSLVAGQPQESPLLQFAADADADLQMPPEGERLAAADIATLTSWISQGAVWPDGVDRAELVDPAKHWSFQPVGQPVPPQVQDNAWPRGAIDRFVLARLEAEGLTPRPEAPPVAWLRRVSFDLTGLPPAPEQVTALAADASQAAYERIVDELLTSPRYGERWAQHWLDVVRYADTHGFEVNTERPNAWPYRDYVIEAFNRDTPYDQFVREQIVGDALGQDAATGFLLTASVLLPGQIGADDVSKRLARQDAIDEIVTNIGQTFLGLSIGCARCHDHKFDPISSREYYAMQAFVAGVEYEDRELHTARAEALRQEEQRLQAQIADIDRQLSRFVPLAQPGTAPARPSVSARSNTDRFAPVTTRRVRFSIGATNQLEPCIDELEIFNLAGTNVALAAAGATVVSSGDTVVADRHELRFAIDGNYGNSRSWMSNEMGRGWLIVTLAAEHMIDRVVWGRDRQGEFADRLATDYTIEVEDAAGAWLRVADATDRQPYVAGQAPSPGNSVAGMSAADAAEAARLMAARSETERSLAATIPGRVAFAGKFRAPDEIHLLRRGDPEQPLEVVAPGVPAVLGALLLPLDAQEQRRRSELADWIANADNPLTARVMANRIWQGHFGVGLVDTPNDLGHSGGRPSHPELLDWLAGEFVRAGWSIKHLHRQIVLSATYRQASIDDATAAARDTDARLLWRYPLRRLEAEAIRDAMLAVSGRLNLAMYGRGFDLFDLRGGLSGFKPVESFSGEGLRRMIYAHKVRREREAVFGAFDCPDAGQSTARRRESTTPIQALNLLNSRFTLESSEALAALATGDAGNDPAAQVRAVYWRALCRAPNDDELAEAAAVAREFGLATVCRAVFNSNEFLYLP
ncbi:MAG: PSD1 and planctomycete cytochrome C domain-containing protein [Pirellulales bacterium]|nr:PSD1 and planctomycete cytochrome C domain-containing protein [Pirellulales bacterium]